MTSSPPFGDIGLGEGSRMALPSSGDLPGVRIPNGSFVGVIGIAPSRGGIVREACEAIASAAGTARSFSVGSTSRRGRGGLPRAAGSEPARYNRCVGRARLEPPAGLCDLQCRRRFETKRAGRRAELRRQRPPAARHLWSMTALATARSFPSLTAGHRRGRMRRADAPVRGAAQLTLPSPRDRPLPPPLKGVEGLPIPISFKGASTHGFRR